MKKLLLLTFLFTILTFSQNTLKGRVLEKSTGKPIYPVNIYFNETTMGTTTDSMGYFKISNIPDGKFHLIASMIGYEKYEQKILLSDSETISIKILLKQTEYKLDEISIEAEIDEEWQDNYEEFKKAFLGTSSIAQGATIINPEIINFSRNEEDNLTANSSEPILITHNKLGYEINVSLLKFEWNTNSDFGIYKIHTQYKEKDTSDIKLQEQWKKNRNKTYKGSLKHFFNSLAQNKLYENNFRLFMEEDDIEEHFKLQFQLRYDSQKAINDALHKIISNKSMGYKSFYSQELISIYYLHHEDYEYTFYKKATRTGPIDQLKTQLSWIKLVDGPLFIDKDGNYDDINLSVQVRGYWSWKRFGDKLPVDYFPVQN